ncbi:hypothetical protein JCGZ_00346 [Jatropha curcas]|uniref:Leucine-rich repeat-containing N-terminal plant-type domain-containing protein n=1 Tax=Jatropha curcas TaxID=180498 RepID=A0A067JK04_JATCU|nr:hypothetical protein JCGZ_00346 [Jatropha curcas]
MAMILKKLWISIMMVLLLEGKWWCNGCLEDDRIALLNLKAYFNHPNGKAMGTWQNNNFNCCQWSDVSCDPVTGRVTLLYAWRDEELEDWYLNASFFLPFKGLKRLYLYGSNILGCVENEGFERLLSLSNLEFLDLGDNKFNESILPSLSDHCKGAELSNLTSLEELNLSGNEIEGFEFSHGLPNLQYLDLSYNRINNTLSSLNGFPSLKHLDLSYNSLKGIFHMKELDGLSNLEELDLSGNQIIKFEAKEDSKLSKLTLDNITTNGRSSSLLQSLGAFPYLKILSLKENDFKGKIFAQESHNMNSLEELRLDYSSLREISIQSLGALPSLKFLSLCFLENTLPAQGNSLLINLFRF